jgi:hypothetical protein
VSKPSPLIRPRLVGRQTAAAYLGLAVSTFDAIRAKKEIKAVPVPAARGNKQMRVPLFDLNDLDALVDSWKNENGDIK